MIDTRTPRPTGDLTPELLSTSVWSDEDVARAGIPVIGVPFVTVGGGMGSFVMVDLLRIAGVPASNIRALSNIDHPWQTYEYLTRCSQIPRHERIRSDSSGCPDNIWAFPSYAVREAWTDKTIAPARQRRPRAGLHRLLDAARRTGLQRPRSRGDTYQVP